MANDNFHIFQRRLPHWRADHSTYFVTFRLLVGTLSFPEIAFVRQHVRHGHGNWYTLIAVQVMPDHVHVILSPFAEVSLSRIMKGIKGSSARAINELRATKGNLWQDENWDRIVRDEAELDTDLEYMLMNPVKAGLTDEPETWCGWYFQRAET